MNQTLVIGSAVVDVIVRVEHLPKCGEDVHVSRQSRSLGGLRLSGQRYSAAFRCPLQPLYGSGRRHVRGFRL